MKLEPLLTFINAQHGTSFRLGGPLRGGYQGGAFAIVEPTGRQAVLKLACSARSAPVVHRLRSAGYPTPDLLFWGAAPGGTRYLVQEHVPGSPLAILTPDAVEQLITVNALQSSLNPNPGRPEGNWSDYARNVVFANESGWAAGLHTFSTRTAALMNAFEAAAAPFGGCVLPVTDAVHGDWCVGNVLAHEGRITGIVDSTAAGYGTRAIDLASLLHYAYADEYENAPGLAVRRRLWREILALGGEPMLVVLLIYRAMALVEFAARHHGEEGVAAFTAVGWKILRDLSANP